MGSPAPITCICAEPFSVFSAAAKRRRSGNHGRFLTAGPGVDPCQFVRKPDEIGERGLRLLIELARGRLKGPASAPPLQRGARKEQHTFAILN
jgi:hypothetical protein